MTSMRISSKSASTILNALARLADRGFLRIYAGERPTHPSVAPDVKPLAELRFHATSFNPTNGSTMRANGITDDDAALGDGTATWCRVFAEDGQTALWDDTAGSGEGVGLRLGSATIKTGQRVTVEEMVISMETAKG